MGLEMSSLNTFIAGDTIGNRYDIYKMNYLDDIEYLKVEDLLQFNLKKAVEPKLIREKMPQRLFQLIKKIDHPNMIKPNFFIEDGHFYVVRTYDDDYYAFAWRLQIQRHLQERHKHIEIEEEQIVYWLKQLLETLACLHRHNILHKFIIPEAMSFKKDKLKLFIPARSLILDEADDQVEVNQTWYRCPEHDFNKQIGLKYDIWSLGWLLFNLCSLEDARMVLDEVKDFNTWERPIIPRFYSRHLDKIFREMTQLDPDERPSAEELLEDEIFTSDYLAY